MEILPLFCDIDDFCLLFEPLWQRQLLETRQRRRASTLCLSEVMTIIVLFHASHYRDFKSYYTEHVMRSLAWAFPRLLRYLPVEAAQITVRRDEGLKSFYLRLLRRRGARKAKVAVARKLLVRCYILLRDGIDYSGFLRRGVEARPARLATWA